ncbi:Proteasome subunit beta type-4 [Pleurotus pulmonarius]|nr:Proteasome subunit beta type-4 [Pleurotus pulmonarius]
METSFALTGKGYVIVASDTTAARSIVKMKIDEDKVKELGPHLLMAHSGEPGDTIHFSEYVERNIRLYNIRHNYSLSPSAAASWVRRSLAESLRSRHPYSVNLLLGGYDVPAKEPHLYWIDYLGTMAEVPFAAHGYGSYFALSLLDRYHNPDASLEEGIATLKRCIDEVAKRLIVSPSKYSVKVVDKDGVRMEGPALPPKTLLDSLWRDFIDNWRSVPSDATVIVILGASGSGRSTFINAAIGRQRCATSPQSPTKLDSVTKKTQLVYHKTNGETIVFIDTPGLDIEGFSAEQVAHLFKRRAVVRIICLCPLTNPRATGEYENSFEIIAGREWGRQTLFVTTMWHDSEDDLARHDQWAAYARDKGAAIGRFRGKEWDALRLVKQISTVRAQRGMKAPDTDIVSAHDRKPAEKGEKGTEWVHGTVIAVIGPTGAGKSTFINYANRNASKQDIGHSLESFTSKVQPIKIKMGTDQIVLVDTPGFDDTNMSDTRVLNMVAEWLRETYNNQMKLAGIIYMHRISDNRMTGTPLKDLKMFSQLCGTAAAERVVLVTTMWGGIKQDAGVRREDELKSKYWKDMIDKKAQIARFEASYDSARAIIEGLCKPPSQEGRERRERSSSTPTHTPPLQHTARDEQVWTSTPGSILPSERSKGYAMPNANDAHPSPAPDNRDKRARNDDLRTRDSNTVESAWEIIDNIVVDCSEQDAVELQQELVALEKELRKTGSGMELFSKLQALVKREQDTLHRLRGSMKRHDDEIILNALKEEYEELRLQTEATVKEMQALKKPVGKRLRRLATVKLDKAAGEETETKLEGYYQKTMLKEGSRLMCHMNTFRSASDIVDHIIDGHNERNNVELQKEMDNLETRLSKTTAGKEHFGKFRALVQRQQDILCLLRESNQGDDDQFLQEMLKDGYDQLRRWTEAETTTWSGSQADTAWATDARDKGAQIDCFREEDWDARRLIDVIVQPSTSRHKYIRAPSVATLNPAKSDHVAIEEPKPKDIVIADMGSTGAGKSTGNEVASGKAPNDTHCIQALKGNVSAYLPVMPNPKVPTPARSDPVDTEKLKTKAVSSEDIVIAVMGPTGAGKSTLLPKQFISHASRNVNDLIGHNLGIYTSKVQPVMIKTGPHKVILVDTPAFDNPNMSDMTILGMIADWLLETYKNKVKLSGIIYMHRISDNRMAGTPLKIFKTFAELCGTAAAERVILVTTMWSQVKKEVGIRREAELRSKFWKDLIDKGAKVERFDASFESAWAIIGTVHQPLGQEGILLQEELANLNKHLSETRAGKTLYNTLQKQLDEEKRLLKELYDEAETQDSPTLAADLKTQYEQVRRQLDVIFREVESLKIPLGRRILQSYGSKKAKSVFNF